MTAHDKTIGILVARMASSRLPGKALRVVHGKPLLDHTLARMKAVAGLDEIWLATTQHPSDEALMLWAIEHQIHVLAYPGETDDVVGRISAVLRKAEATRFLMVLGDTPFPDTGYMTRLLEGLDAHPTWETVAADESAGPVVHTGIACFRTTGWEKVDQASRDLHHREHAGSILKETPELLVSGTICEPEVFYHQHYRLTVDTPADLDFIEALLASIQPSNILSPTSPLPLEALLTHLAARPDLPAINTHVRQRLATDTALKILIGVQAGGHFGTGHLERCKTLARVLTEQYSYGVSFWVDTPVPAFRQEVCEMGYEVINSQWSLPETLRQRHFDKAVLDFQDPLSPSLMQRIHAVRPEMAVIVVDNNGMGCHGADAVIFPNAHALPDPRWAEHHTHIYHGAELVLLGNHFMDPHALALPPPGSRPSVLITMGGTDPENLTEKSLYALQELRDCHLDVVVPRHYLYPENLEKIATRLPSTVTLHWRIDDLIPLMAQARLAVCAFGITAYELAYMGVPTLLLAHHPEQVADVERFCRFGSAINLGDGPALEPTVFYDHVVRLLDDPAALATMAAKGKEWVDGQGVHRVARIIVSTSRSPVLSPIG